MNLKQNYNQQEKQLQQKLNQHPEQQASQQQQQVEQQWQQQRVNPVKYPEEKSTNHSNLTVEKLKTFPGLNGLTDEVAQEIADTLILLSQITYELFQKRQLEGTALATTVQQSEPRIGNSGNSSSNKEKDHTVFKSKTPKKQRNGSATIIATAAYEQSRSL